MGNIYNIQSSGTTSDAIWVSNVSTNNAYKTDGTSPITLNSNPDAMVHSSAITRTTTPLKGLFLNIDYVAPSPVGTLTIILSSGYLNTYTFTYYTSALLQGSHETYTANCSQYWQGFDLNGFVIPTETFKLSVICSVPGEVRLVGTSGNNYNRVFVPTGPTNPVAFYSPTTLVIGNYLPTINNLSQPTTVITYSAASLNLDSIAILNNSVLDMVSPANCSLNSGHSIVATPGSIFNIASGSNITIYNGGNIVGYDMSTISAVGTDKLGITYLSAQAPAGSNSFSVIDDISTWKVGDSILFTSNASSSYWSSEILTVQTVNSYNFTTTSSTSNLHHATTSVPYGPEFYGAPICNLSRDIVIRGNPYGAIRAEKTCNLVLKNVSLVGLAWGAAYNSGAINLYNTNSTIYNCSIAYPYPGHMGILIEATAASNFNIESNIIHGYPTHGIYIANSKTNGTGLNSKIHNNVSTKCNVGLVANYTTGIAFSGNTFINNTYEGVHINTDTTWSYPVNNNTITNFNDNICFNNSGTGMYINTSTGSINNNITDHNGSRGLIWATTNIDKQISINNHISRYNPLEGIYIHGNTANGGEMAVNSVTARNNNTGVYLKNAFGVLSGGYVTDNTSSIEVIDCFYAPLHLYNLTLNNNVSGIHYYYPSNNFSNFFPTYISNSNLNSSYNSTCIILDRTRCEKFVVENTTLQCCNTCYNVTLLPSTVALIEGSYIFSGCTFTGTAFDNISAKYQSDVLTETGFVSMYENGNMQEHHKYLVAGKIESDTTTYHNGSVPISEKLTPQSATIPLRSSKKLIPVDNYDSAVPPSIAPEYLYVTVWVKKSSDWGSNPNPVLKLASNPALQVFDDVIIDEHDLNTTDWVQLSSATPIVSAISARGVVEVYIECYGTSNGSINIDSWAHTFIK